MLEGVELEFKDSALKEIVNIAIEKKSGARALRSVMEDYLMDIMYSLPDMEGVEKVVITGETIKIEKNLSLKLLKIENLRDYLIKVIFSYFSKLLSF